MKWSERVQLILDTLCRLHPTWVADDVGPKVFDLSQRGSPRFELNRMFAETVRYELGPAYGLKRADPGRPISSENLSKRDGAKLHAWAWENAHDGTWEQFPESEDISDQTFVEVQPVNHLGTVPPPDPDPDPPPPPQPPPDTHPEILARLDELERVSQDLIRMLETERLHITELETRVAALEAEQGKSLKVTGKTEATWGHQHVVNLDITTG